MSPQVSRTLLSIQADLNNAVVWMVRTFPLSSLLKPLETVPSAPTTIGITVTHIFLIFSAFCQDPEICLSFPFLLFSICSLTVRQNPLDDKFFFSY